MTWDADRSRARRQPSVAQQSPPEQPSPAEQSSSAGQPLRAEQASRAERPSPPPQPQASPSPRAPASRGSAPRTSVPHGSPPYPAPSVGFPPQTGSFDGRDAPLIHPAAAQASSAVAYGVPVYRAPVYGPPPQRARGLSITALVLGICSFVFAWTLIVVPILGIVFGLIALRREPAGKTMATVGLVGSGIGLLWVLLFYVVPFGAFFSALLLRGLF